MVNMVKRGSAAGLLFFLLLLAVLLASHDAITAEPFPGKVLLLTSYHQGDPWNDSMVLGVREALDPLEYVSLSIENLDLRRYTDPDYARLIKENLRGKYLGNPQDLVLVADDPALNFLLAVREDLFPNIPVVFCGVNNFSPKLIQGQSNITGVNEALSLDATLELALKLFPQTTRIMAVVSDTEANGRTNLEQYRAAVARMKGRVQFDELLNMTDKDAPDTLSRLPTNSLVLRLIDLHKPEGGYVSIQDTIRILSTHAPVPVFTLWSFDLGDGALGGYVSSGQDQGRTAANLAIRILEGQEADQISVVMESPNVPMFDFKVMERFGIKESSLPKGNVVLNFQVSVWKQYWGWFLGLALFCGLQAVLILTLLTHGKRLRAANASLQESEHFTRSLLETIPVPVFYKGKEGRYQGFNKAFLNFYGKNKDELIGKTVFDITSPDIAKVYHANDLELFNNPGTQVYPYKVKTSCGDLREVIFHKASLTDEHGVVIGLIGAILDVTELKRMERRNQVLADIIQRSQDFIGVADMNKMAFFVNPAGQALVGLDDDEAVAETKIEEYFLAEDWPFVENTILPAVMKEGRWAGEFRFRHFKTGQPIPILYELFLTEDPETEAATNFATISRDITEHKQAEEERKMLNAQLQQAQKMEAIGTLAGGIAHDFNNMLGAIIGYSEMIRDDFPPGSPGIHNINQVVKAGHRAKDLVKQILTFSHQVKSKTVPVQPAVIVKEVIALLRSSLPTTITIKQDIDPDVGMVLADPVQIHQMVMNLATNAFHAMEAKGGTLTISLHKKILSLDDLATIPDLQLGTFVQLSIRDTGEGVQPGIRERMFDPFFTTKEVGKGTGLGLSMVYSIVKSCNGAITCNSQIDEGTEFRVFLPALEGHGVEESESTGFTPHGKEHILLVDDEEMLADLGQAMLERLGYRVTTRRNSLEALTTFQEQPDAFDLIITDQTMPGMTGLDLARKIMQIRREMPIILCTGYSSLTSEDKARASGIKGFALKPLAMKDIGELIRKVLDGKNF
jgi:two-component system, cell cycle sensor histidine kinase and response regulator CckA